MASQEQRNCQHCGRRFEPKRKDQVFHSRECQRAEVIKRYHLSKFQSGKDRRIRYSVAQLRQQLSDQGLQRSEGLDALAAYVECDQQLALWSRLKQERYQALMKCGGLSAGRCVVLRDGEPPPALHHHSSLFGVSSTDGLLAVLAFATEPQPELKSC